MTASVLVGSIEAYVENHSGIPAREDAGRPVRPERPRPARYRHCPWRYRVRSLEPGRRPARRLTRRDVAPLAGVQNRAGESGVRCEQSCPTTAPARQAEGASVDQSILRQTRESAPFRGTSGIASRTDLARLATSGSPHLVASILWPLPDRQLHKYQPAGPRDARERRHNLLAVHVARGAN
jgi:hypothetical protein